MTPWTWLGRLRTREAGPRRNRPQATLILDALPDRDSPSSIDPSEFALVIGAGIAGSPGTESRPMPAGRADGPRSDPVLVEVRWDPPVVSRSQPDALARVLGLSEPLPAVTFPTPATNRPNAGDAYIPDARRQLAPVPAPPTDRFRSVPTTGAAPAVVADRPAEAAVPAVVRFTPAKPPLAPPAGVAAPPAVADGEDLAVVLSGRIVWVDPPAPLQAPPTVLADDLGDLPAPIFAPQEPPLPPATPPASPEPAANGRGKAYDPTPVTLPPTDAVTTTHTVQPTAEAPAVRIWAAPGVGGQPVSPHTPAFHVAASDAAAPLVVPYTLAAHDAAGTVSVTGAVTLTGGAGPVVITPGPALARRAADVLTLTARQRSGAARWASATVFLAPAQRVGDAALFEAHRQARSPEAFRALVRRHGPAVTQACQRVVGNRADAEDVSQFVFLELARWRAPFSGTLAAWLRAVARNASLAFLRAKRRRQRHEREAAEPVAADAAALAVLDETLAAAVAQLPVELGEAVRLRYLEGYTQLEAAAIVGCPRGTLSRRAAEGIQLLRERLAAEPTG